MSDLKRKKKEYTAVTGGEYSRKRCYRRYYRSASEFDNDAVESSMDTMWAFDNVNMWNFGW